MKTVKHRTPVMVYYKPTEQFLTVKAGDEFPNDHPIAKDPVNAYLFEDDKGEGARVYGEPSEPVEQATKAPGEKRAYVRKPKDGEPVNPKGNGPIRSDSI